ncbi:MAG: hypothetical protein KatS3mg011_0053 [Acidimicrobiia bacterium]|nr:MAG: hypothetical protein KatS3mg011_0053 [Acidimicrobiia bacterium]
MIPRPPRVANHVETPIPVRDRRLGGPHWWDPDRIRHLDDMPHHCPACGFSLDGPGGIVVEYWEADRRMYHVWCKACRWAGDVVRVRRMIGHEAAD